MNKDRIGCVVAVALVLGVVVWGYYRGAEEREAKPRRVAEKTRIKETSKQTVKELAERHNAILDWAGVRQRKQGAERIFTFELQDVLQKHGDRAIVIVCCVDDVFKMSDGFRIVCQYLPWQENPIYDSHAYRPDSRTPKLTFLLEVDEATARHSVEVHSKPENEKPYAEVFFAFAVLVKRATVALRPEYHATVEAGTYGGDQEAEVVEWGLSPRVLITGKCLEMVYLEGYDPWVN
jgi:hypothetical protein